MVLWKWLAGMMVTSRLIDLPKLPDNGYQGSYSPYRPMVSPVAGVKYGYIYRLFQDEIVKILESSSMFCSNGGHVEGVVFWVDGPMWLEERFKIVRSDFIARVAVMDTGPNGALKSSKSTFNSPSSIWNLAIPCPGEWRQSKQSKSMYRSSSQMSKRQPEVGLDGAFRGASC